MNFEFSFDLTWILMRAWAIVKAWFRIQEIPSQTGSFDLFHDTILVSASNKTAIVQSQRIVKFKINANTVIINNPFYAGLSREAKIVEDSICAVVNGEMAQTEIYREDYDSDDTAFTIKYEFQPKQVYEIFAVAKYKKLSPFKSEKQIFRTGLKFNTRPHRISFIITTLIKELHIEIFFLDVGLTDYPIVSTQDYTSSIYVGKTKMRHRSILENHYIWFIRKPGLGKKFEISWFMPEREAMIGAGIALGSHNMPGSMDILSIFIQDVYLYGPYAIIEARQKILDIISSAKKRIVVIDPYVDGNTLRLLSNVGSKTEIIIVTRPKLDQIVSKKEIEKTFSSRGIKKFTIIDTWDIHDRFIIVDDNEFYTLGTSLKDIASKVCIFVKFNENDPIVKHLIKELYDLCNIKKII